MDKFKEVAHKTVAELFDMLREKQYTVDALTEIGHEKQQVIDNLKAQLECCRKENAVLVGKLKDALDELESALSCCESTETECVLFEIRKPLRGEHE